MSKSEILRILSSLEQGHEQFILNDIDDYDYEKRYTLVRRNSISLH